MAQSKKKYRGCECGDDLLATFASIGGEWQTAWQCANNCNFVGPRRVVKNRAKMTPSQWRAVRRILRQETVEAWRPHKADMIRLRPGGSALILCFATEPREGSDMVKALSREYFMFSIGRKGKVTRDR